MDRWIMTAHHVPQRMVGAEEQQRKQKPERRRQRLDKATSATSSFLYAVTSSVKDLVNEVTHRLVMNIHALNRSSYKLWITRCASSSTKAHTMLCFAESLPFDPFKCSPCPVQRMHRNPATRSSSSPPPSAVAATTTKRPFAEAARPTVHRYERPLSERAK